MLMSYAKGARTWERHVDIDYNNVPVSTYCSLPEQCDTWFKAFKKAKEMCGGPGTDKRIPSIAEVEYLDALVRGVYVKRDLPAGHQLTDNDVYLAVPLLKGQLSCRELISGEAISQAISADQPLTLDFLDNPYSRNTQLREQIEKRGL